MSSGADASAEDGTPGASGLLRALLAASVVVPLVLFAVLSWQTRRQAYEDATNDTARAAEVAREHAAKVFDSHVLVADRMDDMLRGMTDADIRAAEGSLREAAQRLIAHLPQVQSLAVVSADGGALLSTDSFPVPRGLDLRDRDYFQALKSGTLPLYISAVQVSRFTGLRFFGIGRLRGGQDVGQDGGPDDARDGRFTGLINVAVAPTFFSNFYNTILGDNDDDRNGATIALVRDDGQLLVRFPPVPGVPTRLTASNALLGAIRLNPEKGSYTGPSNLDRTGPDRLFTYRKVHGYPAYVVAGRSLPAIQASWQREMLGYLAIGIPAALLLFLATLTALRRTDRERRALAGTRAEMRRREIAEDALRQSQKMEAIGQLTGGIAHDFNNLLTVVIASLEMIGRYPQRTDRVTQFADMGLTAARRGAELTSKLLSFARRQLVRPDAADLNRLLTDFAPLLRGAVSRAVEVRLDLAPGLPPALVDAGQFEAAVLNLVVNARDAMPDGGIVTLRTGIAVLSAAELTAAPEVAPGRFVSVAISDTGTGMPPDVAAHAFEPFFTTKDVGRGTGLGLSQVYGFTRQAGGLARLRSAPGEGTTVELLLPPTEAAPAPAPAAVPAPPQPAAGTTVLVVDDDPVVLAIAVASLQELGYATRTAAGAADALAVLRGPDPVDLLFSDVVMPGGMDGARLAAEARQVRPGLKVLLASGYTADVGDTLPAGLPVLAKPYQQAELANHVAAALA